jgi:hypothetical protein
LAGAEPEKVKGISQADGEAGATPDNPQLVDAMAVSPPV